MTPEGAHQATTWHLARVEDSHVAELLDEPQLWESGSWAGRADQVRSAATGPFVAGPGPLTPCTRTAPRRTGPAPDRALRQPTGTFAAPRPHPTAAELTKTNGIRG